MRALTTVEEVKDAAKIADGMGRKLLLVFGAPRCERCGPFKEELHKTILDEFELTCAEVDVDDEDAFELTEAHAVTKLPTVVIFSAEAELCRLVVPPISEVRTAARAVCEPKLTLTADF